LQTSLDHLPPARQAEFARIQEVILEELETRIRADGKARAKRYRLLKLVLFGSFAKGTWFEDSRSGRASDIDLLAIVSHEALTEMSAFWGEVENRLYSDPLVKRDVSIIVHTLQDVNRQLKDGQYFFSEIIQQGILLYEDGEPDKDGNAKNILAKPAKPDAQIANSAATKYFQSWSKSAQLFLATGKQHLDGKDAETRNFAAFQLHQAAESAYRMFLLTTTLYAPGTHHLGKLRSIARTIDGRIEDAWGPPRKPFKRYFELLRRAYVEARYSPSYETTQEILTWQADRIEQLISISSELCSERLERLEAESKDVA
jgi:predicted nucleotidyltransferase/HEPN domain-containing protein